MDKEAGIHLEQLLKTGEVSTEGAPAQLTGQLCGDRAVSCPSGWRSLLVFRPVYDGKLRVECGLPIIFLLI